MHVLNGAIYGPTFSQSTSVYDMFLSPVLFAIYIDDVSECSKFHRYSYVILYADDILLQLRQLRYWTDYSQPVKLN